MPVNYKKIPIDYVNRPKDAAANDGVNKIHLGVDEAVDVIISRMVNLQNVDTFMGNEKGDCEEVKALLKTIEEDMGAVSPFRFKSHSVKKAKEKTINDQKESQNASKVFRTDTQIAPKLLQVPSTADSVLYYLPVDYTKRNPWRRIIGFHSAGLEVRSSTYPARSSVQKLRFAQAKKPLNYLYSYFSVELLDCDDMSSITIGISRKDYPSKVPPGKTPGSVGYCSDTGSVFLRDSVQLEGPKFSRGDVVGCGVIYPSHYKRYVDLSTDENSDGMSDVILTSILNKKSMDFVCNVLHLNASKETDLCDPQLQTSLEEPEQDYYNENFVESRTQVEVYFTYNMQVLGKVLAHIPIGGFYPTIHVFSKSAIKMKVDLNPPSS